MKHQKHNNQNGHGGGQVVPRQLMDLGLAGGGTASEVEEASLCSSKGPSGR